MLSRSLCKTRNNYIGLKLVNTSLVKQLSCSKTNLEYLSTENTRLRKLVDTLKLALNKFSISSSNLNLLIKNQKSSFANEGFCYEGPKHKIRHPRGQIRKFLKILFIKII